MGNDIEIRVRVANQTNAGLTAVNNSLRRLKDSAQDAGRGLDGLTARATAATVALRALKDAAQDASRALRSLNTAARNADTRMGAMSDRSRTLRRDTDELDGSMRRLTTTMRSMRGSNGSINLTASSNSMDGLRKAALLLSPALIPIAAATVPIIASAGAATVAVGAFGAAVAGQVGAMRDAADAQGKYTTAVKKHGPASEQATKAEAEWLDGLKKIDPQTRRAGAAMQVLGDSFSQWSKDLAGSTMPVFTKGMAVLGGLLPQMAPLVRSTSTELDRLMTVLAGGVNSDAFSGFMASFSEFASGALSKATDGLVRFMRTMSEGAGSSQFTDFMAYVKEVGPQVGETLANLGRALTHLIAAASDTGVSLLSIVNAFAGLVNAIPTGALSNLLQFVVVFKAVRLAALGLGGAGGALSGFGAQLAAMYAASVAAGGGLSGLAAGFGALSRASKVALIGSGIGILVVALSELSEMSKKAPADVDKLTTSMREFATGGTVSGEAARTFGKDLSGLSDALQKIKDPKGLDKVQQSIVSFFGTDSTPVKEAKENIDALDKSLANLVKNGQADLAASALDNITAQMKEQGFSTKDITSKLDDYKAALADQAFEAQLAAQAQGLFGEQAAAVQTKLDAQKASADGLRQSIQALSDTSRNAFDAETKFEQAVDDVTKGLKENGKTLDIHTDKGRANRDLFSQLASATQDAAAKARENGESWSEVMRIYDRGKKTLVDNATQILGNKKAAEEYVASILKVPTSKATLLKMDIEDATAGLNAFNAAVKRTPGSKSVTLKTLSKSAEQVLETFGFKVTHLKDGSIKVTAATGGALTAIRNVQAAVNSLHSKTIGIGVYKTEYLNTVHTGKSYPGVTPNKASGGLVRGYAGGGDVQMYPDGGYIQGPGSGTSDSILTLLGSGNVVRTSNTEFIVNARETARHRRLLELINSGQLPKFAKGGSVGNAARGAKDEIRAATSGSTETRLLSLMNAISSGHIKLAAALKQVSAELTKAKDSLASLRSAASQLSGSVRSGVLSASQITSGAGENGPTTLQSITSGLIASRDKATAFSGALGHLKSMGLRADLIQQIAEAGISGGGLETAGALMGASSSEVQTVNSLQSQIASAAKSAGQTTANAVYGATIKAQEKLVTALDGLTKALKTATGKKAAGGIVGAAASGGIRSGLTWVGEHEPELLDLPSGSRVWSGPDSRRKAAAPWASMLNSPHRAPSHGAVPSAGVQGPVPVVLEIRAGDNGRYTEFLVQELRRAVKANGSIEATLKPPRGR